MLDQCLELEYPANVLKEFKFDEIYLTPEQESRFNEIVDMGTIEERDLFTRHYALRVSLDQMEKEDGKPSVQVENVIAQTVSRLTKNKNYILTGERNN